MQIIGLLLGRDEAFGTVSVFAHNVANDENRLVNGGETEKGKGGQFVH